MFGLLGLLAGDFVEDVAADLAGALCDLVELDADAFGDAAFLHGDAVERVAALHGALVVGDDDEVAEIEALIVQRNQARSDKNWALADDAREKGKALKIILEDSDGKTTWRKSA